MAQIEYIHSGERKLYSDNYFSGNYDQSVYLKKSKNDGSGLDKFYIELYSKINGIYVMQGYIYFYLNIQNRTSHFIGIKVLEEYRNLNMASLLTSLWINFCLNNGFDYIGVHHKQRKPFILYMLKNYSFDVFDLNEYKTRKDVISICRSLDVDNLDKYLMFKDERHKKNFMQTNIYKTDNYKIIDELDEEYELDKIIFPLQDIKRKPANYYLKDKLIASEKSSKVLTRHKK